MFGLFHPSAQGSKPAAGVLICPPFGWEDHCSYRSRRAWAEHLANEGYPALRIDFPGSGDSAGGPGDADRLGAWSAAAGDAAGWLRAQTDCERVVAIGIGLGGLIACLAVSSGEPIDDLVLWAVPARGRRLVREQRAFAKLNQNEPGQDPAADAGANAPKMPMADGSLEAGGFLLSGETVAALDALDLSEMPIPEASRRRVLLLERDQIGFDRQLGDHLERSGVATSEAPGDGYTAMMAHPQVSRPPLAEFESVGRWLSEAPAAGPSRAVPAASREPIDEVEIVSSGRRIRERPFTLDLSSGRVFGILSEPADAERGDMGAVLLNAGALRRIGPGRLWVDLARSWAGRGIPTLRLDLRGIGDADGDAGAYTRNASFYVPELVDQVLETLDALEQRGVGSRFVLGGLCSGAYWSFHAALRDQRVRSALLMNPMILYWDRSITAERDAREVKAAIRDRPGGDWSLERFDPRTSAPRSERRRRRAPRTARRVGASESKAET